MTEHPNRRHFLGAGLATGAALLASSARADGPADHLTVGVMGTGGRGTPLATLFAQQRGVPVKYVCDVDRKRAADAAGAVNKAVGKTPQDVQNFHKILDDKTVDILVVATCTHWHAPAAILGC